MQTPVDVAIVGSGFGGSVAALRAVQKGHRVVVLEEGRRWRPQDFPRSNWDVRRFLWAPGLGCRGIQRIRMFRHFMGLAGAGVGGGSLVYAATLLAPPPGFFTDPSWAHLDPDWAATLAPHYDTARRMLGVAPTPRLGIGDLLLKDYAASIGRGDAFRATEVGIFFGEPGVEVPDPYFGGEGPNRTGCDFTGACMVGCRSGAKNSLDRNYLHLAERRGVTIEADTRVTGLVPDGSGGWWVHGRTWRPGRGNEPRTWSARRVVVAAGTLGTVELLLHCREQGWLPGLSPRIGERVRTNSEVIVGARSTRREDRFCEGIAIASQAQVSEETCIEVVRYPEGSDVMGFLGSVLTDGGRGRPLRFLATCLARPLEALRIAWVPGWARRSVILLVMQSVDNQLRLRLERSRLRPWTRRLVSDAPRALPTCIPEANAAARAIARAIGGIPQGAWSEVLLNRPLTAHVLGGCPMGGGVEEGVVDRAGRVFGHEGLYVCDGSIVPANLGVNPSLTITALAEHVMEAFPEA
ncbi:MAG: GMC family oxidoreductase [Deltaproteobacteria bacterium]|nr:GMC family oxidoreductase [Deltaproteobacteria bacterium]